MNDQTVATSVVARDREGRDQRTPWVSRRRRWALVAAILLALALVVGVTGMQMAWAAVPQPSEEVGITESTILESDLALQAADDDPIVDGLLDDSYVYFRHFEQSTGTDGTELAPGNLYVYTGTDTCYWAFVVDRAYNDNVFADDDADYLALDGWDKHKFRDLERSDGALFDLSGSGTITVWLDYLNENNGEYQSGQGGDGWNDALMSPISEAATSLYYNMTASGWTTQSHSPPYDWNDAPGQYWEWHMIYEFSVPMGEVNGLCSEMSQAGAHNSPSKDVAGLGAIGDTVWYDADRDGVQDPGEDGIPGVRLILEQSGTTLTRTTETEPGTTGYYLFNNLEPGTYTVTVDTSTLPANYTRTYPENAYHTVTIAEGETYLDADFGYVAPAEAGIDVEKATNGQDADDPTGPVVQAGDPAEWTYVVTNIGSVTLTNVTVTDDQEGEICSESELGPADIFTCTATGVAAVGQYGNMATVQGTPSTDAMVTDTDPSHYLGVDASITIEPDDTNEVGESHTFTVTVTAAGAAPTDWAITPAVSPTPDSQSDTCANPEVAADGMSATCSLTINDSDPGQFSASAQADVTFSGPTVVSVQTDGSGDNSDPATKTYVDAAIQLTPLEALNVVGDAHTITAAVLVDDGSGAGWADAPDGTVVTFTLTTNTADADFVNGNTCTTTDGACSVQINADAPGEVEIHAATDVAVGGLILHRETDGQGANSGDASKTYAEAGIDLEKYVSVDDQETWHDADSPTGPYTEAGSDVFFRFVITNTGNVELTDIVLTDTDFDTEIGEQCDVPTALAPGDSFACVIGPLEAVLGQHSNTGTVEGDYGDESYDDTDDAHYVGVDAWITIEPDGTNEVGDSHTFTITVTAAGAEPTDWAITPAVSPTPDSQSDTCANPEVAADGMSATCWLTVNDSDPGQFSASAQADVTFSESMVVSVETDDEGDNSGPATKTYVDAAIQLTPLEAVNVIGDAHTITATVLVDDGSGAGWADAPDGTVVTFTLPTNTADADFVGDNTCATSDGACSVQINADAPGEVEIHAATDVAVGGLTLYRETDATGENSGDASKTYAEAGIDLEKYVSVDDQETWHDADSPTGPYTEVGGDVYFRFIATNTGEVALSYVTLTDTDFDAEIGEQCDVPTTLAAGDSFECVIGPVEAIPGQHSNTGTVEGDYDGETYDDTDDAHYFGESPAYIFEKTINGQDADTLEEAVEVYLGDPLTFTYALTNTGNVPIKWTALVDDVFGDLTAHCGLSVTVGVGEAARCEYTDLAGDYEDGKRNIGTASVEGLDDQEDPAWYETLPPTAVTLLYFRAEGTGSAIRLLWETAAEWDMSHYRIYRAESNRFGAAEPIGLVFAEGSGSAYEYLDEEVEAGKVYWYWLGSVETDGWEDIDGPVQATTTASAPGGGFRIFLPLVVRGS